MAMADGADVSRAAKAYCWTFGNAEFDEGRWQLRVAGQDVELEHKPLEVLQYLLRHAGEAVTKEELLSAAWAGRVVVEAVLTNAIGKLRRALADEAQDIVMTLPRVGYRLAVAVSRKAVEFVPDASQLDVGDTVPRRPNWKLEAPLARTGGNEVWLARHAKTRETRVFKFSLAGKGLNSLKREVTIARLLREALGERDDFVHVLDWDFEEAPYFIESEYGGLSLDQWPASGGIGAVPRARRLALFVEVADSVGAAHGVGVLHKDLKPANLLVYGEGDEARMRVADFGSSRLFDSGRLDELGITHLGLTQTQAISTDSGTPLYLAPEVVAGQSATIKSDVYALGVTLYQLLIGDFRRQLSPGWENDITDPLLRQDIADAANGDPAKRLESAAALAERIRTLDARREKRALELAVQARVAEGEKRLAKARARRPWMIAAMLALAVGIVFSGFMWRRSEQQAQLAEQQRDKAEKQAKRAESVVSFLSDELIRSVNPGGIAFEQEPTIRDMLEVASSNVARRFAGDPATLGSIQSALGASWRTLGDRDRSAEFLREAVENYTKAFGRSSESALRARYDLANTYAYQQDFAQADRLLQETDSLAGSQLAADTPLSFGSSLAHGLLDVQRQEVSRAIPALKRADRLREVLYPTDAYLAARIRINLADLILRDGRTEEAAALLNRTLADPTFAAGRIGGIYTSALQLNLARALRNLGRYEEALPLAQMAVATSEKILGPNEYQTLVQMSTLSSIHENAGSCREALGIMRVVQERMAEHFGAEKQATIVETGNLASQEFDCGDRGKALGLMRDVINLLQRQDGGNDNVHSQVFRYELAGMLMQMRRHDEALLALDGLDAKLLTSGDSTPGWQERLNARRAEILIAQGKQEAGHKLLAPALDALVKLGVEDTKEIARMRGFLESKAR
jgi:eukaryotic-like serine/threonine-protein kinase